MQLCANFFIKSVDFFIKCEYNVIEEMEIGKIMLYIKAPHISNEN